MKFQKEGNGMKKVALVTGSTQGIGKATIIEFAKKDYNVVINYFRRGGDREAINLQKYIEENYNVEAMIISADIRNEEEIKNMVNEIIKRFGRIDCLVNNAGIAIDKEFEEKTTEDFLNTLNTNLIGPFLVSKYVGFEMMKKKQGKIINISSTNGINSFFPTSIDYDASKAALINLTHNLAIQFAPYINVNAVAPGWVNTKINADLPKDLIEEETEKIYLKKFAEPEQIAKVIVFLASDDASYINSEVIKVDGGY